MAVAARQEEAQGAVFDPLRLKKARALVESKIKKGQRGLPYIETLTITPEVAAIFLERNPQDENRKLSLMTVNRYAADMMSGRWKGLNGQTIVISADGYLNDGQHRSHAIIQSGAHIPMAVVFGAERQSRLTLDQNRTRTSGDYLHMQGVAYPNNIAAMATNLLVFGKFGHFHVGGKNRPTKTEIHAFAEKHMDELVDALDAIGSVKRMASASQLATFLVMLRRKSNPEVATEFMQSIVAGEDLQRTMPAYHARERLISEKIAKTLQINRAAEIIFRCWNSHRRGERMRRLSLRNELPSIEA